MKKKEVLAERLEPDKPETLFREVISRYTLEDAIEDGTYVDFGNLVKTGYRIIVTTGVLSELNKHQLPHAVIKHACMLPQ